MNSSLEDGFFSDESDEERFIRCNLSFLIESDDDFQETVNIYHGEVCIYATSIIDSSVTESWSILSTGSRTSPREKPSKFSSLYIPPPTLSERSDKLDISDVLYLSFLMDDLQGHTSTPVKNYFQRKANPSDFGIGNRQSSRVLNRVQTAEMPALDLSNLDLSYNIHPSPEVNSNIKSEKPLDLSSNLLDLPYNIHSEVRGHHTTPVKSHIKHEPFLDLTKNSLDLSYTLKDDNKFNCTPPFTTTLSKDKALDSSDTSSNVTPVKNWLNETSLDTSSDYSYTESPTSRIKNVETQTEDIDNMNTEIEIPPWKLPTKNLKGAPIQKLNRILKSNEKITYKDDPQLNESILSGCIKIEDDICHSEVKPLSLTLGDFLENPSEDPKPVVEAAKPDDENKENEFCRFCFKNGELPKIFTSHVTKRVDGKVICPILRKYVCTFCGATGDDAHTRNYCRLNNNRNTRKPFFRRLSNGILTTCHNHK